MEKEEVKIIGTKIMQGHFEDVLEVLDKKPDRVVPKTALYLIVCCCAICNTLLNKNSVDKLNEQKLITTVIGLSKCMTTVTNDEYDSYLQSIFFICKLLTKKNYELLLQLEAEILPRFIPEDLTEKQKGVYRSICGLIQNEVVNMTMKKDCVDEKKIILMGNLLSKVILKSSNHAIFVNQVVKYGACLQHMNVHLEVQYNYFSSIITVMKDLSPANILNGILQVAKYSISLFCLYLKDEKTFENATLCINETLNIIPEEGEWGNLKKILSICKYVIDPCIDKNELERSRDCLIKLTKLSRQSENFYTVCKLLSQSLVTYSNLCKNCEEKQILDPEKHLIIYEILSVLAEALSPQSCQKDCKCLSKNSIECSDTALCILILFSRFLSTNITMDYTKKVEKHLKKYFEFLVHRKQQKCELHKKCWSDAAPYLYNVGVIFLRKEKIEEAESFGHMILKYHSLLGEPSECVVLPNTFNLLDSINLKQKKYKESLIWSAIEIINTDKNCRNKLFYKWIKIKADCREDSEIQELTIISILNEIPTEFTCYISQTKTKEFQIDLLVAELENYYIKWKSKIPMMSAFRHLCQIADKLTIMKVFAQVFTDEDTVVHEEVPKLLKDVFRQFENCQENLDSNMKIYLSFFMFFQYKHQTIELISKNLEEMNKVVKPKKVEVDVIPEDALDRCDTVSVYENLKVNGEKLKTLVKAVSLLEEVILSNSNQSLFTEIEMRKIYELTRNISFEFILHSDGYNVLRSLYLAFNIAQLLDNKELLLECTGFFLRHLNYSDIEDETETNVKHLKKSEKSYKYLLQYYMNLSYFHVSLKNVNVAYKHYKSAKKYQENLGGENDKTLWCIEIGMELLLFKLLEVAKPAQFDMNMKFSYGPLMKAYNMIVHKYTTGSQWTTYSMILLLEIFDSLVKMYYDLKMPREVRCFGKQCLTLAQQHVIPVYSSKILSYLAYADLWSEKWDDCRVKIEGISDILLLNKTEWCSKIPKPKNHLTVPSINDIMEGIKEIMLDAPSEIAYDVKSNPASPVLQVQSYRAPFFINHMLCKCFHCTSAECQQVIMSYYHLEGLWHMHKGQITLADSFFKGVFKLHESLLDKRKDMSVVFHKYASRHSEYFRDLPRKECEVNFPLNEVRVFTSISYVKFLSSSGAQEPAKKFCENALKKFKTAKIHHPHLYGELLLQKLCLMCRPEVNNAVDLMQVEDTVNNDGDVKVKTPEASVSTAKIPKIKSPRIKKFLPPKVIQFNLTDSCSKLTPSKATNDSTTIARTPKVKILPPSLRSINTPKLKTAKKSIFEDDSKKSTPSINCQNITPEHEEKQKSPLTELSDLQAINSKQSTTDLGEKTKLLTSRLRKKQISENNSSDKTNSVKQTETQALRRSRRNRT